MAQSPHLAPACADTPTLTTFLRGAKFSLARAKEKFDNFHVAKALEPQWFGDWDPLEPGVQVQQLHSAVPVEMCGRL